MSKLAEILKLDLGYVKHLPALAQYALPQKVVDSFKANTARLRKLEEQIAFEHKAEIPRQHVDAVMQKLKTKARQQSLFLFEEDFSKRELRIAAFNLIQLWDDKVAFHFALQLLEAEWTYSFASGLVFGLIHYWRKWSSEQIQEMSGLLLDGLADYDGRVKKYQLWLEHGDCLKPYGDKRLADYLIQQEMDLLDAPKLLGYRPNSVRSEYFSDVFVYYIQRKQVTNLNEIERYLQAQDLDRTKKLVLAHLVKWANVRESDYYRFALCNLIFHLLGHVGLRSTWLPFDGATAAECALLIEARQITMRWLTKQYVETFFLECVEDQDRLDFWLGYITHIRELRVVVSKSVYRTLERDSSLKDSLPYIAVRSNMTECQTCALVMRIKDRVFVEFSDKGSLYVYHKPKHLSQIMDKDGNPVSSIKELKITDLNELVVNMKGSYINNNEGRLPHYRLWQHKLKLWFAEVMGIY